ncbi:MAG: hypothetical protein Q8R53_03150 [Nanoarchaeota archaeon]|nr:hypothetical protein [Nanoarchaeota archaeon]
MTIVKINLHKLHAERNLESKSGQVNINNNVSIKDVEDLSFSAEGKKGIKFTFAFNCAYEPALGKIEVEGQVLYVNDEKIINEIKANWEKEKRLPMEIMEEVVNAALHKGNIQAIKISEEVNLPSPLPLPRMRSAERKPEEKRVEKKAVAK